MTAAFDGGVVTRPPVWLAFAHRPQPIPLLTRARLLLDWQHARKVRR